ncbi:MAG TPA: SDR family oxidoreductase [Thermoleophilia bacterium]|nr:SDR family oxidoreductase [Thermoleophilia bacterium]
MEDLFSLEGKSAVVVGGAGGMGRAIAAGLIRYGADVALADVNPEALEQVAAALVEATGKPVRSYVIDCTDEASVKGVVDSTVADMGGRVDVLVNALGYNVKGAATEFPMDEWDKLFSVNVKGVMMSCKHFGAQMVKQGGGKIINLSSVRGQRGALGGNSAYCASKGAVDMITKQLACELAQHKVFVNALGPIITVTPMTAERISNEAARYERMLLNVPMGRMAHVDDLVGPSVFLASAASDFITGTVLYVDGGTMSFV